MYRIYTEDTNRKGILACVSAAFEGFTVIPAQGYWKGERENSLVLEFETEDAGAVYALAESIRTLNHQEAVLVTYTPSTSKLITA